MKRPLRGRTEPNFTLAPLEFSRFINEVVLASSITLAQDRILASMSLVQRQGCVDPIGWVCQELTVRGGRSLVHSMQHFLSRIEADSTRRLHAAVRRHGAERNAKGFISRGPLVAMRFCQLGSVNSLRDITNGLAASEGKLRTWACPPLPGSPPWAMPPPIAPARCSRISSIGCWKSPAVRLNSLASGTSSASRTNCCRSRIHFKHRNRRLRRN